MSKHVFSTSSQEPIRRGFPKRRAAAARMNRCVLETLETRQLLTVAIPLLNQDFQSPMWVQSGSSWVQETVPAGTQISNSNQLDPRFGPPGFGKTAVGGGGGIGPNGEGLYSERNDLGYNQYFDYVDGSLPSPASGVNFFCIQPSTGYTYTVWVDQQTNSTGDAGNHSDLIYPPMIPATFALANHQYQVTVALGNPLVNGSTPQMPATVQLDLTLGAGTYNEPSNTNSYLTAPQPGDTSLYYNGYGTTVASATAASNDPNWQLAPGTFKDLTCTWTCPSWDAGQPLDVQFIFSCGSADVCMSNIVFQDLTALPYAPPPPTGVTAYGTSSSQINLDWGLEPAANSFNVYESTTSGQEGTTPIATGITGTSYSVTGLNPSTNYYFTVAAVNSYGAGSQSTEVSAMTGSTGTPVAITVPDNSFASDATGYYIDSGGYNGGNGTFTSPLTATLSGWSLVGYPSTANGGYYSYGGWNPFGAVDSVTGGGGSGPYNTNAGYVGSQPASSYNDFIYYPGEQWPSNGVVTGAQPGASLSMTTTGISATAVTGNTYTATIQYANASWSNCAANPSANVSLNILANGTLVSTTPISGLTQNAPWTTVTAGWVCPAAYAGEAIQIQAVASKFLEGPSQWEVPDFAFANATLTKTASASGIPAAPSNLMATAVSYSQINLTWQNNANNQTGFTIERATNNTFTQNVATFTAAATATSYSDTGLTAGTTYYYEVCATNGNGSSPYSASASATILAVAPSAPTGLTAATASYHQINLSWSYVSSATSYNLYQGTTSNGEGGTPIATGITNTMYSVTGLSANTSYYYQVAAVNSVGTSTLSSEASATTTAAPGALVAELASGQNLSLSAIGTSLTDSAFEWDSNNETVDWFTQLGSWLNGQGFSGTATLHNHGGSGAASDTASEYSTYAGSGFTQLDTALADDNPNAIFIEFAVNDAYLPYAYTVQQSENNLQAMIDDIENWDAANSTTTQVFVQTTNNTIDIDGGDNGSERPQLAAFYQGYSDVAAANPGVMLINNYPNWLNLYNTNPTAWENEVNAGVHPNNAGIDDEWLPTIQNAVATSAQQGTSFPAAPSGLTATATSPSQVNLSWTNNASNQTGFTIYQATSSDFSTGLTIMTVGANVTSYSASGLSDSTYYFRVRATNANGDSVISSTVSATPTGTAQGGGVAISVPNSSFASPAQASGGYSNNSVTSWTIGTTPGGASAGVQNNISSWFGSMEAGTTQFAFINTDSNDSFYNSWDTLTSAALATVSGGQTYTLTVGIGNRLDSPLANNGTYTISLLDGGTALASQTYAGSSIAVGTWYDLTLVYTTPANVATGTLQVQLGFSTAGYTAGNPFGQGDFDNVRLVLAPSIPAVPSGLTATVASQSQVNLTWTNNATNQTGFTIQRATNSSFTQNVATFTVAASATSYSDASLTASTTYYYEVCATNGGGASAYSAPASAVTLAPAAILSTLVSFNGSNGQWAADSLVSDSAGNLYGTTGQGGANNDGTVFEIPATTHVLSTLLSFNGSDGSGPYAKLIFDAAGDLYGLTASGGAYGDGTVFELVGPSHTLSTLVSFNGSDGSAPVALVFDATGDLYGTTAAGGASASGTLFEIPAGTDTLSTLVSFNYYAGAAAPNALVFDAAGNLYGTTGSGGAGTLFEIPAGTHTLSMLVQFNGNDGNYPNGGLICDSAGNVYGVTGSGGGHSDGTVFEVSAETHTLSTLASFNGSNGEFPLGGLIGDAAGNLYGTTSSGGANGDGTIFQIAAGTDTLTTLVSFRGSTGNYPEAAMIADSSGNLYGTTTLGGVNNDGTVFELSGSGFVVAAPTVTISSSQAVSATSTSNAVAAAPASSSATVSAAVPAPMAVTLSNTTILANQSAGTIVGTLATTGTNTADTFSYKLVAGKADDALFKIKGHSLKTKAKLKAGTYQVKVRSLDAAGHVTKKTFSITVV